MFLRLFLWPPHFQKCVLPLPEITLCQSSQKCCTGFSGGPRNQEVGGQRGGKDIFIHSCGGGDANRKSPKCNLLCCLRTAYTHGGFSIIFSISTSIQKVGGGGKLRQKWGGRKYLGRAKSRLPSSRTATDWFSIRDLTQFNNKVTIMQ